MSWLSEFFFRDEKTELIRKYEMLCRDWEKLNAEQREQIAELIQANASLMNSCERLKEIVIGYKEMIKELRPDAFEEQSTEKTPLN